MPGLFYRPVNTLDAEERLEDACLWTAMHDHYGAGITIMRAEDRAPDEGVTFGRGRYFQHEGSNQFAFNLSYWKDPGFQWSAKREIFSCDLDSAIEAVDQLRAQGKGVFIKAREQKLIANILSEDTTLMDELGDLCYSFMDRPDSLLVQEAVEMRNERRFMIIDRQIVTCSPVQFALTPLSRSQVFEDTGLNIEELHFETPRSNKPVHDPALAQAMREHVLEIAARSKMEHAIIDLCTVNGEIEVIEFNPMHPGQFGLFAARPDLIAKATEKLLPDDLLAEVHARRESGVSFPLPKEPPPPARDPGAPRPMQKFLDAANWQSFQNKVDGAAVTQEPEPDTDWADGP